MKAINGTKLTVLATKLKVADGFYSRLKGLIGSSFFTAGEGLWMAQCRAIHTIGMRFPIDVIFVDRDLIVRKTVKSLRPFCPIVGCLSAKSVLELPEGSIEKAQVEVGDRIEIIQTSEL